MDADAANIWARKTLALARLVHRLESNSEMDARRKVFCQLYKKRVRANNRLEGKILRDLMTSTVLFPSDEDKIFFLKFSLEENYLQIIKQLERMQLIGQSSFNIHEFMFEDGKSALHYLVEKLESTESFHTKEDVFDVIVYLLDTERGVELQTPSGTELRLRSIRNYRDNHGYTYLHGACMAGLSASVNLLVEAQPADVNIDTYPCSPLHVAAQHARTKIVEILLDHGADPNGRDRLDGSTPLHALARPCRCDCASGLSYCDYREPVDEVVKLLVERGAYLEALDRHGDTPLQVAIARLDASLAKNLLKRSASLDNLDQDRMFGGNFSSLEMKCYPFTLNIIEIVELLRSEEYELDLLTRYRMMKCWMMVRGNDMDYLIGEETADEELNVLLYFEIIKKIYFFLEFGFCIKEEAMDYLLQRCHNLRPRVPSHHHDFRPDIEQIDEWMEEVDKLKGIKITKDVSLYQLCQMNYNKGYSIVKSIEYWLTPAMDRLECASAFLNIFAKRHIANILIKPHLTLIAADLLETDYYKLHLPYTVCRRLAGVMSDDDLFDLFKRVNEDDLAQLLRKTNGSEVQNAPQQGADEESSFE
ncbi:uncharacterized protein LOC111693358 [Trichogramma pretiosum]|uniref:uncharacterized protein LOC111693358 n=1 Tax=Trichogramma pretiosum TaxID=7493 RepID=UPI000C719317|nr:uncharacterized protein LOC111693358 [Trichogramma pretiosum]